MSLEWVTFLVCLVGVGIIGVAVRKLIKKNQDLHEEIVRLLETNRKLHRRIFEQARGTWPQDVSRPSQN